MKSGKIFIIIVILTIAVVVTATIFVLLTPNKKPPLFSTKFVLQETWKDYKEEYLEEGTNRTMDKQRDFITTSEGQSYTMLRSVWLDDKEVFDESWQWTKDNLQREEDKLFSWLFGERPDGSYGIISENGGENTASDGDTDIALALIFAYSRWRDKDYLDEAIQIIQDIWKEEVIMINETPYLAANNVEKESEIKVIINPSYLAPYAYKIFSVVDLKNPWNDLVESSYEIINRSLKSNLDKSKSASLAPDWIFVDRETGEFIDMYEESGLTSNYSYDAIRTPWRVALDWLWFKDPRAKETLSKFEFLENIWKSEGKIYASYYHDGIPIDDFESIAVYGTSLGYFIIENKDIADQIYNQKLSQLYDYDFGGWKEKLSYYDDNWTWFGLAMYFNELPNLANELIVKYNPNERV